jgi:YgiT-type zinc finger domain-containing protein
MDFDLAECPTCGGSHLKKVRRNWKDTFQGQTYVVPNLEYWECPDCGEQLYDRDAMRKIEAHSPAYAKRRAAEKKTATGR